MTLRWIDNYAGTWADDEGRTLVITPRGETTAEVTLLVDGRPMPRPWCANKPAEGLRGTYRPGSGPDLDIELGRPGFSLNVNYESDDPVAQMNPKVCPLGSLDTRPTARRKNSSSCLESWAGTEEQRHSRPPQ